MYTFIIPYVEIPAIKRNSILKSINEFQASSILLFKSDIVILRVSKGGRVLNSGNTYISENYLQNILNEMKAVVEQDLIYMNTDGVIIASTDKSRKGQVHRGGKKVTKTGSDLIIYSDNEYEGAKKGINMPVKLNNIIVGVIGITGNSDEVMKYVKIIKRLTEILIKEGYNKDVEDNEIERDKSIMDALLYSERQIDKRQIVRYESLYGIKNKIPRIVIASTIVGHEIKRFHNKDKVLRIFRSVMKDTNCIISLSFNNIVTIIDYSSREHCNEMIDRISKAVNKKLNLNMRYAIGDVQTELNALRNSYLKAISALKWSLLISKEKITYYEDFDLEIILNNISPNTVGEYVGKVLNGLKREEYTEYSIIIRLYEKHNGSIKKISEELYIHKNTLQYKINKLYEITGYDMRKLRDFAILSIAFQLKKMV